MTPSPTRLLDRATGAARRRQLRQKAASFYGATVRRGCLCFDVGANLGDRTRTFLELGARVVAVEPQDACIAALRRLEGPPRLVVLPVGLDSAPGTVELLISDASTISTMEPGFAEATTRSGRFSGHTWGTSVSVRTTTLDHVIGVFGVPDFCKIDVEGAEARVLGGLHTRIPAVSFEVVAELPTVFEECVDLLANLGPYTFSFSPEESFETEWRGLDATTAKSRLRELEPGRGWGDVYASLSQPR